MMCVCVCITHTYIYIDENTDIDTFIYNSDTCTLAFFCIMSGLDLIELSCFDIAQSKLLTNHIDPWFRTLDHTHTHTPANSTTSFDLNTSLKSLEPLVVVHLHKITWCAYMHMVSTNVFVPCDQQWKQVSSWRSCSQLRPPGAVSKWFCAALCIDSHSLKRQRSREKNCSDLFSNLWIFWHIRFSCG